MFFVKMLYWALAISAIVLIAATLVGRAYDHEVQQHVLLTRHGVTLDCEHITDVAGNVFYDSCVRVP